MPKANVQGNVGIVEGQRLGLFDVSVSTLWSVVGSASHVVSR